MIEYVNLFLLLTLLGIISYIYHRCRRFFRVINTVMDSTILNQIKQYRKRGYSEVTKSKRGHKKKTDTEINEEENNNIIEKRDGLITCVLSGNSKQYLGKEYTEQ